MIAGVKQGPWIGKSKGKFGSRSPKLRSELGDILESGRPEQKAKALKLMMDLENTTPITTMAITSESLTGVMATRQRETAPTIDAEKFSLVPDFEDRLVTAIKTAKPVKAPGPGKIRTEMMKVDPELFAKALLELWKQ